MQLIIYRKRHLIMIEINLKLFLPLLISVLGLFAANAHAQQIALLDTGADPDRGFNLATGFNFFDNDSDTSDISPREGEGHGTVSTRVASESFSGQIVPYVVSDGTFESSESAATSARDSALLDILSRPEIRVIGLTVGTPGINGVAAPLLANLSADNRVIAINAGNSSSTQPNALSTSSFNLDGVIIVGATDAQGNLLSQSNRAGVTAENYVAAIGLPTLNAEVDPNDSGASWATARISGIAGEVLLQNPNLTSTEVAEIIFESAEDRGAIGTDVEYGQGVILNAEQVLNNAIGELEIPTEPEAVTGSDSGGGGGSSSGAGLILAGAVAGGIYLLTRPRTTLEKTLVLDSYGRAFEVDLTDQISVNDGILHLDNFFQSLEQKSFAEGVYFSDLKTDIAFSVAAEIDHTIDLIEHFAVPGDVVIENDSAQISFQTASQLTPRIGLATGYRTSPDQTFGASSSIESHDVFGTSSFITGESFSSLLTGFSEQAQLASLSYAHGKTGKFTSKLGFVSVDQKQDFGLESFSSILEGKYQFSDNANIGVQFGQIEEQGSLFGGSAGGVFGVDSAVTYALNFSGSIKANDKFSVIANYGIGRTKVDATDESLLDEFSDLSSNWYSLGLIGNDVFRAKDQLGIAFSQPLKIRSGSVDYSIPTGQDIDFNILFNTERVNLSDTQATEHRVEAYYRTMLNDKIEFGSYLSFRDNPNHVSELGDELLMMTTIRFYN